MSAAGIFPFERRARVIGAHADYNRADFLFLRTQSLNLRDLPWEERLKPLKSWSEIAAYWSVALFGVVLLATLVAGM
ncbi:MAG TPA: hypothetical protein VLW75_04505 [Rhizomicrobium sp.]|nr:hypothetical protein [Rhizomicrobium sp.]